MPKIDKLLAHAIVPPFLLALTVLTFIVFVHDFGTLSELLVTRNASFGVIVEIAGAMLPGILIFSLPLSYLIGILIGLSGLSGESQIIALRACGVPMRRLLRMILLLGGSVGLATALLSVVVYPRTNDILREVKDRISISQATTQIQPRVFNADFSNIVFYVDDLADDRQHWSRVFLADNSDPSAPKTVVARSGTWVTDSSNRRLQLHLVEGASYSVDNSDPGKDNVSIFAASDLPIEVSANLSSSIEERHPRKVYEYETGYLWARCRQDPPELKREEVLELNRRFALPFAVFPFALLGLTLGVSTKKGGRTSGFVISLATVLAFYILFFNGIRLASVAKVPPWLGAWGADLLLAALGLALLARIDFGIRVSLGASRPAAYEKLKERILTVDRAVVRRTSGLARFSFPKILDVYISRGFFVYFLWSLVACGTLFVLFTLFELLDDIIRNRIPLSYVLDYFTFLTPQILMLVAPMSVLLAVLISFGILEKNSEITAIKAGGWSLYRVAIPVVLISASFSTGLFLMQDYILPYSNARQDRLRNVIKGRPAQTTTRLQRKWIFGEAGRIFNYEYFDGREDSFVDLNIYEVDFGGVRILRRMHADKARVDPNGIWTLEKGWVRDYRAEQSGFSKISKAVFHFPEKAGYFEKEIFQPKESSKLTYPELKSYIQYLMKSGYNATELQVELYKKIAFPLSCLVMAMLGVPFSFSTGRHGAFFGIGVSIAIAMSYWGISGLFEAMGAYGLLVPLLSAWAPNILFGFTGLAMLLTIRT